MGCMIGVILIALILIMSLIKAAGKDSFKDGE